MQSYHHFTQEERFCLAKHLMEGKKVCEIAREINRSPSTISREIKRNWSKGPDHYNPWRACNLYAIRRKNSVRKPRLADEDLFAFVSERLNMFWSPEIITAKWKLLHPKSKLSHSTIYAAVRRKMLPNITPKTHLRRHGKRKYKHNTQTIHPDYKIADRPDVVDARVRLGDFEGDTVYGAIGKGCIVTMVDRTSRLLCAALAETREKEVVRLAMMKALDGQKVESITLDNGSEFAAFREIQEALNVNVYFADPHSPWQRGTNENTNGLIRFFFPKGTDFLKVTDEELQHVVEQINNRPRKCLGWLSPLDVHASKCCT